MPELDPELKEKYANIFSKYPDVVDLPTLCEMLGASEMYVRSRLRKGIIRSFLIRENHTYRVPKEWVIEFALSPEYQAREHKKGESL